MDDPTLAPVDVELVVLMAPTVADVGGFRARCPDAYLLALCDAATPADALPALVQAGLDELLVEPVPPAHHAYRIALLHEAAVRRPRHVQAIASMGAAVTCQFGIATGRLEYVSPAARRHGFDLAALAADPGAWATLLPREDAAEFASRYRRALDGEPQHLTHGLCDDRGEVRWVRTDLARLGESLVMSFIDITAERALEASVSQLGHDWRATLDSVPVGVLLIDQDRHLVQLNATARAAFADDTAELRGTNLEVFTGWQPWATAARLVDGVLAGADHLRATSPPADDGRVWELSADVLRTAHAPGRRVIVMVREITVDLRLRRSAELNERMATLGSVVAGVAHEVRNPLFGISAIVDALEIRFAGMGEVLPHLDMLRSVVTRLSRLMNELLALGSNARLDRQQVALTAAVDDACAACAPLASEVGVAVRVVAPTTPTTAWVDRGHLTQVVQNLVDNALRHAPRGSEVTVTIGQVDGGRAVRLTVRDHGRGFGANRARALEPFFSRRKDGTGLGLAIVAQLIERHDGTVTLADAPDGGALVTVEVPVGSRP